MDSVVCEFCMENFKVTAITKIYNLFLAFSSTLLDYPFILSKFYFFNWKWICWFWLFIIIVKLKIVATHKAANLILIQFTETSVIKTYFYEQIIWKYVVGVDSRWVSGVGAAFTDHHSWLVPCYQQNTYHPAEYKYHGAAEDQSRSFKYNCKGREDIARVIPGNIP